MFFSFLALIIDQANSTELGTNHASLLLACVDVDALRLPAPRFPNLTKLPEIRDPLDSFSFFKNLANWSTNAIPVLHTIRGLVFLVCTPLTTLSIQFATRGHPRRCVPLFLFMIFGFGLVSTPPRHDEFVRTVRWAPAKSLFQCCLCFLYCRSCTGWAALHVRYWDQSAHNLQSEVYMPVFSLDATEALLLLLVPFSFVRLFVL